MQRSSSSFQLLGLDIMITTDWHIWFIESNNYPLWPQGGWITDFTLQMGVYNIIQNRFTHTHVYYTVNLYHVFSNTKLAIVLIGYSTI